MRIIVRKLMEKREVEGDEVTLVADNGDKFSMWQTEKGEIRLACNGTLLIEPRASNLATIYRMDTICRGLKE